MIVLTELTLEAVDLAAKIMYTTVEDLLRARLTLTEMTGQCHDNHVLCTMSMLLMVMTFQWQRTPASCRAGLPGERVRPGRSKSTWIIML